MMKREDDQPLLRAEGLSKWYGKQLGCRDVSFALYPGEVIAVVGESGFKAFSPLTVTLGLVLSWNSRLPPSLEGYHVDHLTPMRRIRTFSPSPRNGEVRP